jgi:hypothetical protein
VVIETSTWDSSVIKDFINGMLGKALGSGVARQVWVSSLDETLVVKVQDPSSGLQNLLEWETYLACKETKWAKYLTPCIGISPCGLILVQKRIEPLNKKFESHKLPNFLTDFKRSNYGMFEDRVVCCDYGTNQLIDMGAKGKQIKLITPEWWD